MKKDLKDRFNSLKNMKNYNLTVEDFARSFGTSAEDISDDCKELITKTDFRYRIIDGKERDDVILNVLRKIESDKQKIGSPERENVWEKGWSENLNEFVESNGDLKKLVPKFIRPNQAIRLNQKYVMPSKPNFELDYFSVFRLWIFKKYLKDFDHIYEFGCGTGFNLVVLASLFPEKKLYGLDYVASSVNIVNKICEIYGWDISGHLFNMISPDEKFKIKNNSAIFTFGSVEQLASKFDAFLQFLLKNKPKLCIHMEPTIELYDGDNLIDYLAIKFHKKRGYTEKFLTRLKELEEQGKIEILKVKRLFFGSLYMEGFSYIVWKPKDG